MAITLTDIQEKVFATQATDGYSVEQVDDFLDEIVDQMAALTRENVDLQQRIQTLEAELSAARAQTEAAEAKVPDYDEDSYFQNLKNSVRESLISAQRIADETTGDAERKAKKLEDDARSLAEETTRTAQTQADELLSSARAQADELTAQTRAKVEEMEKRYEALKASAGDFKTQFAQMLEQQSAALKACEGLF